MNRASNSGTNAELHKLMFHTSTIADRAFVSTRDSLRHESLLTAHPRNLVQNWNTKNLGRTVTQ